MKKTHLALILAACGTASPIAANATPVTFNFTGSVTVASGSYNSVSIGSIVTGTYTFDFANANPGQSSGTVGSPTSNWLAASFGGTNYFGSPPPVTSYVFSSTAMVAGFTYATAAPTSYLTTSGVRGLPTPNSSDYQAVESSCIDFINCHSSSLLGASGPFGTLIYKSDGLPLFSATPALWTGQFSINTSRTFDDYLRYQVTSLTQVATVPEPTTVALIAFGLLGIVSASRKRTSKLSRAI